MTFWKKSRKSTSMTPFYQWAESMNTVLQYFSWRSTSDLKHKGRTVHGSHKYSTVNGRAWKVICQLVLVMEIQSHKWKAQQHSSRASLRRMADIIPTHADLPSFQTTKCETRFLKIFPGISFCAFISTVSCTIALSKIYWEPVVMCTGNLPRNTILRTDMSN